MLMGLLYLSEWNSAAEFTWHLTRAAFSKTCWILIVSEKCYRDREPLNLSDTCADSSSWKKVNAPEYLSENPARIPVRNWPPSTGRLIVITIAEARQSVSFPRGGNKLDILLLSLLIRRVRARTALNNRVSWWTGDRRGRRGRERRGQKGALWGIEGWGGWLELM